MSKKYIYSFSEGNQDMRALLGGKGANLCEMTNLGINVPTGFVITTEACNRYLNEDKELWDDLVEEIKEHIVEVEKDLGRNFNDPENPLLFAIRSGSVVSMPGMMDTVLNLGLNDEAVKGLAKSTNNEAFAYDSYRRFIQMFSEVAMGVPMVLFENQLEKIKEEKGVELDNELTAEDLKELIKRYQEIYEQELNEEFPQDPFKQLHLAIEAVFKSWSNPRAEVYRRLNRIPDDLGTAVNVQSMVFGNMGDDSGTGVAFSRNPATGEKKLFGEYLMNAQGEDVVAGIRTPEPISHLKDQNPEIYDEFEAITKRLEEHYQDMQDLEFTIENGRLYILQTRNGKRTAEAALNIAVDMIEEGLISKEEGVLMVEPDALAHLLHPNFDEEELEKATVFGKGLAASPGAATGKIYFHADDAVKATEAGEDVILTRRETSPEDIEGMNSAQGIITSRGGMTSHAAVVARGMGKCCVAGASSVFVDEEAKTMKCGEVTLKEGDEVSIDGTTGTIYTGIIPRKEAELSGKFKEFMDIVDELARMEVRTNADTPEEAKNALEFGAKGIGLTRTEHMFFEGKRIMAVREMILSKTTQQRVRALNKLLPVQEEDFYGIYEAMGDLPVTIRLLDPPLHEFLPTGDREIEDLAKSMDLSVQEVKSTIAELQETNPMLGHRGCRLAITYPEIYQMQARAIIQAAIRARKDFGKEIIPQIMIPLAGDPYELEIVKNDIISEIEKVFDEQQLQIDYLIGSMIEIPRACLLADGMAEHSEFFSFGTNDLTQMTLGFSRDDADKFLGEYADRKIYSYSPFETIDEKGVGQLVEMACKRGRETRKDLELGICGEHGGDPHTIDFFERVGLDYISCSPFRVPIARLAAAQAHIRNK